MAEIRIRRVYDETLEDDGFRILADRLWPRGITKEKANLDFWASNISPSNDLRKEYHGDQDSQSFERKYLAELESNPEAGDFKVLVSQKLADTNVALLTSAKDMEFNHCHVLIIWLR